MTKLSLHTLFFTLSFFLLATPVLAAPDITVPFLSVPTNITIGQTVTFSGDVLNQGTEMDTTNSYNLQRISGAGGPNKDAVGFAHAGSYIYALSASFGDLTAYADDFEIYNTSDPFNPTKIKGIDVVVDSSLAFLVLGSVVMRNNYAYVIADVSNSSYPNIYIYDVSTPSSATLVKAIKTRSPESGIDPFDAFVNGAYLYVVGLGLVGTNQEDVRIFSLSDPVNPVRTGGMNHTLGVGWSIEVLGNYAYATFQGNGGNVFEVYDVSNPISPQFRGGLLSSATVGGTARGLTVRGNYAYVGFLWNGGNTYDSFSTIDISNPSNPVRVGGAKTGGNVMDVSLSGDYAYLARHGVPAGVAVYDISDPTNPRQVGEGLGNPSNRIFALGRYVYLAGQIRLSTRPNNLEIFEPHTFSRFCLRPGVYSDANRDACAGSAATGRIGGKDFDSGRLNASGAYATSTTWVATSGTHTVYYCSDVRNASNFDGVKESNETNNCTSITFNVASLPTASTNATSVVTPTGANLNGSGNPNYGSATGYFRWGTTNTGSCNTLPNVVGTYALGSGNTSVTFSPAYTLSGLTPLTTYYYCAVATNYVGTGYGSIVSFITTNSIPTATIIAPAGSVSATQGTPITFTGTGDDPDGGAIATYEWRDGSCTAGTLISNAASFSNNTLSTGTHTIYLRVQDNESAWSTNCPSRVITVTAALTVNLTSSGLTVPASAAVGSSMNFTATVSNMGNTTTGIGFFDNFSYQWNGTSSAWTNLPYIAKATLNAGATSPDSGSYTPTVAGTLYIQHCVDSANDVNEGTNETPNCTVSAGTTVTIPPTGDIDARGSDGPITVDYGTTTTVSWTTQNTSAANNCSVSGGPLNAPNGLTGSELVTFTTTITYVLSCDGTPLDSVTITVNSTPTLTVSDTLVDSGDPVTLSWDLHGLDGCTLRGGQLNMTSPLDVLSTNVVPTEVTGSVSTVVYDEYTYTLNCGAGKTASVTVKVTGTVSET